LKIELNDLGKIYSSRGGEDVVALEGVSASIQQGDFVSVVGPSGCGKSTLLDIIAGLTPKTSGDVLYDGGRPADGGATRHVGVVFQKPVLLPWRTTMENVLMPGELGKDPPLRKRGEELRLHARELLKLVGLDKFSEKYPWELSGGMQQRVAIARALLLETEVMCMDEPFAALDEFTREQMHIELLRLWHQQGFTTVFVTHNIFESAFLSNRVLVMTPRPGRIVADVEIDLPRPRTRDMIGSAGFTDNVRRIREAMVEHWAS
jgi:NitT/TauT family transport system ATP-binding protein